MIRTLCLLTAIATLLTGCTGLYGGGDVAQNSLPDRRVAPPAPAADAADSRMVSEI